jgi:ribosome modulation factor
MINYNDKSSIIEAGRSAAVQGKSNLDCPISTRTHANDAQLWMKGWGEGQESICKGRNCNAVSGVGHSKECHDDHESIYAKIRVGV